MAAGLHLVLHGPNEDDEALAQQAQACGLDARPLSRYSLQARVRPGLVIGYGDQSPARIAGAVKGLARARSNMR